jgi:hypothetical protein
VAQAQAKKTLPPRPQGRSAAAAPVAQSRQGAADLAATLDEAIEATGQKAVADLHPAIVQTACPQPESRSAIEPDFQFYREVTPDESHPERP